MKTMKKALCVVLSLLMLFSTFAVSSFALGETAPTGTEDAAKINIKYEVEQVAAAGDYTAVDNNVYAVTIYAKSAYGINYLQVPIHFDKTKFSPFMFFSADPVADGALGYDGYFADAQESVVYDFDKGPAWSDTSMYKADYVTTVTRKAQARYIGLGSTEAVKVDPDVQFVDTTNATHHNWIAGLDADKVGIMFFGLDNVGNTKNAYFNAYEAKVNTDWVSMGTIYFYRNDGVSEADAIGAEFGYTLTGAFGSQGLWDTSGNPCYFDTTYAEAEPGLNYVSNAVVSASVPAVPTLNHLRRELKMDVQDGAVVKGSEQLRVVSSISADDWNNYFANTTTKDATTDKITEVGIVAYKGQADAFNVDTAKAVAQDPANAPEGYSAAKTDYIQNDTAGKTGAYLFGALIKYQSAPFDTTYIAYVKYLNNAGVEAYAFYDTTTIYSVNFAQDYQTLTDNYVAWLATQA